MTRTTILLGCLLLFTTTTTARADTQADLLALYTATRASPTPNMTFFTRLAGLGNFDAGAEVMAVVQRDAQLPSEGLLGTFLSGITRFQKQGDRITLTRAKAVGVAMEGGFIQLEAKIVFRLQVNGAGNQAKIDNVDGARVGESKGSTYPLRHLTFERKPPKTWAHINAGYGFGLNKTKSVVAIDTSGQGGLVQAVSNQ